LEGAGSGRGDGRIEERVRLGYLSRAPVALEFITPLVWGGHSSSLRSDDDDDDVQ